MPGRLISGALAGDQERARFLHNVALFFGNPAPPPTWRPPAKVFAALAHFDEYEESGWHARVLHNFGTALPGGRRLIAGTGNASGYLFTASPIAHPGLGPTNRNREPLGEPSSGNCEFQTPPHHDAVALR